MSPPPRRSGYVSRTVSPQALATAASVGDRSHPRLRRLAPGPTSGCHLAVAPGCPSRCVLRRLSTRLSVSLAAGSSSTLPPTGSRSKLDRKRSATRNYEPALASSVLGRMARDVGRQPHPGRRRQPPAGLRERPGRRARENPTLGRYARKGTHRLLERTLTAFHGVLAPYDACRSGQRPTPGLPPPAVLHLQAFSTS
jgi:hypothetical protein